MLVHCVTSMRTGTQPELRPKSRLASCAAICTLPAILALGGCADTGYYLQSARGHLAMMHAARPVDQLLADAQTAPELKTRLELAQRIRRFAVTDLGLPDNASYSRYADLQRRAVVWNVVAAPVLSLTLKTWCFPVTGCVGYRGYFEEVQAKVLAAELKAQGLEVSVYGVPAYSTLGWMNWAGGDPLLNTFINYPEGELARLIFHELAHQVAYAKDDTRFNESFATAVERLGGARWLAQQGAGRARDEFAAYSARRAEFRTLTRATRRVLSDIYQENTTVALVNIDKFASKTVAMKNFREQYATLRAGWIASAGLSPDLAEHQLGGYDAWVANANNAAFGAQGAYDDLVPDFEALFEQAAQVSDKPWQRFYDAVKRLADLPAAGRKDGFKAELQKRTENNGG
jgi:predicted aminopeptidase